MTAPVVTKPACPPWCDGMCRRCYCDKVDCHRKHTQDDTRVTGVDSYGDPNWITLSLVRQDTEDTTGPVGVCLDIEQPLLHLTLAQAHALAAALTRVIAEGETR